ncbi:MAG: hypothetical protein WCB76_16590, partial [Acidobacteriaceae bacterium]
VLEKTGRSMDDLRGYVGEHRELRRALYKVPHRDGVAGTAAQFVWHVSDLMAKDSAWRRQSRIAVPAQRVA